jgi:hypothetical protein
MSPHPTPLVIYDEILQFCDENMSKTYHCDVTDNSVMKAMSGHQEILQFCDERCRHQVTRKHESIHDEIFIMSPHPTGDP